jgi:hypothetical protein
MRKLFIIPLIFLSTFVFGQTVLDKMVMPVQAGTSTIENGKAVIKLDAATIQMLANKNSNATYYITITPLCDCGQFYVSNQGDDSFTVQQTGNTAGAITFEYIVYVKRSHPGAGGTQVK